MYILKYLSISVAVILGFWTFSVMAHSGVENKAVMARMMAMKEIAASMKYIGKVRRGTEQFNVQELKENLEIIRYNASVTPQLFEIYAVDPLSEAATEIWETFDDFKNRAKVLESTAERLVNSVENKEQLNEALKSLGSTCKSCHSKYRN